MAERFSLLVLVLVLVIPGTALAAPGDVPRGASYSAGQSIDLLASAASSPGAISGVATVSGGSEPAGGYCVFSLFDGAVAGAAITRGDDGGYDIEDLAAGVYEVAVYGCDDLDTPIDSVADVAVTSGATTAGVDLSVPAGGDVPPEAAPASDEPGESEKPAGSGSDLPSFGDVAASSTFAADIVWLALQGITRGCNPPANDRFCPDRAVTRGQMAAFLVRALKLTDDGNTDYFGDDNGTTFEADINKLAAAGITRGCNPPANDRYCPTATVSRGQMAAFFVRALGLSDDGGKDWFGDDDGLTFEADINKLAAAGITRGCNPPANDRYCAASSVSRGQMAAFIHRALGSGTPEVSGATGSLEPTSAQAPPDAPDDASLFAPFVLGPHTDTSDFLAPGQCNVDILGNVQHAVELPTWVYGANPTAGWYNDASWEWVRLSIWWWSADAGAWKYWKSTNWYAAKAYDGGTPASWWRWDNPGWTFVGPGAVFNWGSTGANPDVYPHWYATSIEMWHQSLSGQFGSAITQYSWVKLDGNRFDANSWGCNMR